jgi:hypothetical protein
MFVIKRVLMGGVASADDACGRVPSKITNVTRFAVTTVREAPRNWMCLSRTPMSERLRAIGRMVFAWNNFVRVLSRRALCVHRRFVNSVV